jgi:hypothetical protein
MHKSLQKHRIHKVENKHTQQEIKHTKQENSHKMNIKEHKSSN